MSRWSLLFLFVPVASVAVFAVAEYVGWSLPPVQSTLGKEVDHLYYVVLAICGVAFIFTQLGLAFLVYFYARRPGVVAGERKSGLWSVAGWMVIPLLGFALLLYLFPMPAESRLWMAVSLCVGWPLLLSMMAAGRQGRTENKAHYSHGNQSLEIVWTIVPAGIFLFIAAYQYPTWQQMRYPKARPNDVTPVRVIARQFEWRMVYAGADGKLDTADDLMIANELHVVKGKESWVDLRSMDVIHSFFLPFHRVKQDIVPGLTIPVWFDCLESTWEHQTPLALFEAGDIPDPARLSKEINASPSPLVGKLKSELSELLKSENPSSEAIAKAINDAMKKPAFVADSGVETGSLSTEIQQLARQRDREDLQLLLARKLLDREFAGLATPIGGDFEIVCAELCGWGHYKMKGRLFVHESEESLAEWMEAQAREQESPE